MEQARRGDLPARSTAGILTEVYGALTWERAQPRHDPGEAAQVVRLLVESPSDIMVLNKGLEVALRALELAVRHGLLARRIHDARHPAAALGAGACSVYTYDLDDWTAFETHGMTVIGPPTILAGRS